LLRLARLTKRQMNKSQTSLIDKSRWGWLILFTSSATLICCALPILLVALGLGAVSASIFSTLPFLVILAKQKSWIFIVSGVLLIASAWSLFRPNRACPADPELAELCNQTHHFNKRIWWFSITLWLIGFAAAYLSLPILTLLSG